MEDTHLASEDGSMCGGCSLTEWEVYHKYLKNDEETFKIFRRHGVLPCAVKCPRCRSSCKFRNNHTWLCGKTIKTLKRKKHRACGFSISDYTGTFLEQIHIAPWKILCFINCWLHRFSLQTVMDNLNISSTTAVNWRLYCSQVAKAFCERQPPIGGPGAVVEVDMNRIGPSTREDDQGCNSWVLGGIEHGPVSSRPRCFLVPLRDERDRNAIVAIIRKFVSPGTEIHSREWAAELGLNALGYKHQVADVTKNFVGSQSGAQTQRIFRLWGDVKDYISQRGMRRKYREDYLAHYMFLHSFPDRATRLHAFLAETARLYPHVMQEGRESSNRPSPEPVGVSQVVSGPVNGQVPVTYKVADSCERNKKARTVTLWSAPEGGTMVV